MTEQSMAIEHIYSSKMIVGKLTIYNKQHFNKLEKIIWRICFGIKIKDIKEGKYRV